MQTRGTAQIRLALFLSAPFLVSAICVASVTAAHAQSDLQQSGLPQFSDPYGGAAAYAHASEQPKTVQTPTRKLAKKSAKTYAKTDLAHAAAHGSRKPAAASNDALTQDLSVPPPVATGKAANPSTGADNPLSFGMQWNAANNPSFATGTSTIPAVNEIKRNANEDPVETGAGLRAGVNMKF